ncbi:MAG: hypothetical protein IT447_09245 [Phycisphaerales bacterium]|jgi:hypothetical protein|nr:hypothetical protein [Phycisphaerales bacterium]
MPLRYVILHHQGIESPHYDLMVETAEGSALRTWRIDRWPPMNGEIATPLPDHRRAYLEYEGPLTNHRGHVRRIDAGTCLIQLNSTEQLIVQLEGTFRLTLPKSSSGPLKLES